MRRICIYILLCLILGACTTVVAAWWGVVRPTGNTKPIIHRFQFEDWQTIVVEQPTRISITGARLPVALGHDAVELPAWSVLRRFDPDDYTVVSESALGWPCLALARYSAHRQTGRFPAWEWDWYDSLVGSPPFGERPNRRRGLLRLPVRPLAAGFAIDTIVFGVGWMLLFGLPIIPRCVRAHRRRGIRCVACGYPLGPSGSTDCPECGTAVSGAVPLVAAWQLIVVTITTVGLISGLTWFTMAHVAGDDTPVMHKAIYRKDVATIQRLVNEGFDFDQAAKHPGARTPEKPLDFAVRFSDLDMVEQLLDLGAPVNDRTLLLAWGASTPEKFARVLRAGGDPQSIGNHPSLSVAGEDRQAMLHLLLDDGFDPSKRMDRGDWLVAHTLEAPDLNRRLIESGAIPGHHCLHHALRSSDPDLVRRFVEQGAEWTSLHVPSPFLVLPRTGDPAAMIDLLHTSYGLDLDVPDASGRTALRYAVDGGHVAPVRAFLDAGADPNVRDDAGRTALDALLHSIPDWGALDGPNARIREVFDLLIEHGATVRLSDDDGAPRFDLDAMPAEIRTIIEAEDPSPSRANNPP